MNTTLLADHFRQVVKLTPPPRPAEPIEGEGFVLLASNMAGEVLIEYQVNATLRVWDLSRNGGVMIDNKRHVHSSRARLIVDQMHTDFHFQRVERGSTFFAVSWLEANEKLDELLGLLPPAGAERGRLAA